jgi:hypothetical protein
MDSERRDEEEGGTRASSAGRDRLNSRGGAGVDFDEKVGERSELNISDEGITDSNSNNPSNNPSSRKNASARGGSNF